MHKPECEASGTWVLNAECEASGTRVRSSTQSILEVLLENEFQKYKS